jgi:hypothetical protein
MSLLYDYSSSAGEWDLAEEEDIAMILALHANKRQKHGGFVFKSCGGRGSKGTTS